MRNRVPTGKRDDAAIASLAGTLDNPMLLVSAGYAVEQLPIETAKGAVALVPLLPSCLSRLDGR
jgi:hypothetical protein